MKAAGLKAIDTVVESTSVLVKSKNTTNPLVDLISSRIRGVISTLPLSCVLLLPVSQLTSSLLSRSKVCAVPVQYPPHRAIDCMQHHPWQACSYRDSPRRGGLGCCQLHGGEEEDRHRHGRADQGRRHRYSRPQHRQLENRLDGYPSILLVNISFSFIRVLLDRRACFLCCSVYLIIFSAFWLSLAWCNGTKEPIDCIVLQEFGMHPCQLDIGTSVNVHITINRC